MKTDATERICFLGYYAWEGVPCRILSPSPDATPICEVYAKGSGFQPFSLSRVLLEGTPLSKIEFEQLVVRYARY